jgi:2-polyprenyl-3-methyl-5-hydroxy-6-metoxy-1,4-benzoquinol methylase
MVAKFDKNFSKYAESGAYHWREISRHWIHHQAFTAERYRRSLQSLGDINGSRVLDYGCGDGALLSLICRQVGISGEAHGFDPNPLARDLAQTMLIKRKLNATLHAECISMPREYFDFIVCAEVIEHVTDINVLFNNILRLLKPKGRVVLTTPIRLTQDPSDENHVQEWFPGEFVNLLNRSPLQLIRHEEIIPAAAAEIYFWRSPLFFRVPVFRLLCNLLSIYGNVNALSWLSVRQRLFMTQLAVLEKA